MADDYGFDYETQQADLLRKRKMAELLQGQGLQGMHLTDPKGRASILGPLASMAKVWAGKGGTEDIDTQLKALTGQRTAAMSDWMKMLPTAETPGQVPDTSSFNPEERGTLPGMVPKDPAQLEQEIAQFRLGGLKFGPEAERMANVATAPLVPKSPFAVGGSLYNPRDKTFTTPPEVEREFDAKQKERALELTRKYELDKQNAKDRAEQARLTAEYRKDMLDLKRKGTGGDAVEGQPKGKLVPMGANTTEDLPLFHDQGGQMFYRDKDNNLTRYSGHAYRAGEAKGITAAGKAAGGIQDMEAMLKAVTDDPSIYSGRARAISTVIPAELGGQTEAATGLNQKQLQVRSQIAAMTAETTHSMYGTAFSANEKQQAKSYLVNPGDPPETVQNKLRGRLELEQRHYENLSATDKAAYEARRAGGGNAPAAASDGWGQAKAK